MSAMGSALAQAAAQQGGVDLSAVVGQLTSIVETVTKLSTALTDTCM